MLNCWEHEYHPWTIHEFWSSPKQKGVAKVSLELKMNKTQRLILLHSELKKPQVASLDF